MVREGRSWLRELNDATFAPIYALGHAITRTVMELEDHGPLPPRGGGLLVVANHCSYLDPVVLQVALRRRIRYLMTEDFYDIPSIRWFFQWMRALRLSESRTNLASLRVARNAMRGGDVVGLFPEGELSPDGEIGPARPGAAVLASLAGVPVLPVRIRGTFEVWRKGMLLPRPARVTVVRGEIQPAPPSGKDGRREFTDHIMDVIAKL